MALTSQSLNPARLVIIVLGLAAVGAAIYYSVAYYRLQSQPAVQADREIRTLTQQVGRLILLPEESPTLATVSDAEKLKTEQAFFAAAENGDKVLIYTQAQKAILYRPSLKKIIEVGPVTSDANSRSTPGPIPTVTRTKTP